MSPDLDTAQQADVTTSDEDNHNLIETDQLIDSDAALDTLPPAVRSGTITVELRKVNAEPVSIAAE